VIAPAREWKAQNEKLDPRRHEKHEEEHAELHFVFFVSFVFFVVWSFIQIF